MPGCAAVNCSNSSEKGFLMKCFPRDAARRKQWQVKVQRYKWTPTNNSFLCEVHFAPDMWERTREDGTRKLKANAIPTIFSFSASDKSGKPPCRRASLEKIEPILSEVSAMEIDGSIPATVETDTISEPSTSTLNVADTLLLASQSMEIDRSIPETDTIAEPSTSTLNVANTLLLASQSTSSEENVSSISFSPQASPRRLLLLNRYKKLYHREKVRARRYKNLLRNCRNQLKNAKSTFQSEQNESLMHLLFNKDQLKALRRKQAKKSTKFMKWSNETVTKCLKLKFSCGNNGYNELIKQNYPLPSLRTLQRYF